MSIAAIATRFRDVKHATGLRKVVCEEDDVVKDSSHHAGGRAEPFAYLERTHPALVSKLTRKLRNVHP